MYTDHQLKLRTINQGSIQLIKSIKEYFYLLKFSMGFFFSLFGPFLHCVCLEKRTDTAFYLTAFINGVSLPEKFHRYFNVFMWSHHLQQGHIQGMCSTKSIEKGLVSLSFCATQVPSPSSERAFMNDTWF